ncbi:MAG: stage II sporulation protein D [Ruminococcaceae bacterium]|nr:stage II sporulation protein D [Oscillospiraceae bacterium]
MKGKVLLVVLLFLIMFSLPFLAMGGTGAGKGIGTSSAKNPSSAQSSPPSSSPQKSAAPSSGGSSGQAGQTANTGFKILDTTSGKVLNVDDRSFLYGAIASEVSPTAPEEALKAQGVAAYTYYSRLREKARKKPNPALNGADFSADTQNWQIYVTKEQMQSRWGTNFDSYYKKLVQAADSVFGQVLTYEGDLIDATYFAISSGQTEASEDIWGGKRTYLISVASPGDAFAGGFQTTVALKADQFKAAVLKAASGAKLDGDPSQWIGEIKRTGAGSVTTMAVGGSSLTGNAARTAFGLRSANFTVSYSNGSFVFLVKGYGHGVGMSQAGAAYMANQGSTYQQILSWYYPNTSLTTLKA